MFNREIAFVGGSVTVLGAQAGDAYIAAPAGKTFGGWNTKADGSGTTYQPGDAIPLNAKTTTLYAVWKTDPGAQARNFWQKIVDFFHRIGDFFRRLFNIA